MRVFFCCALSDGAQPMCHRSFPHPEETQSRQRSWPQYFVPSEIQTLGLCNTWGTRSTWPAVLRTSMLLISQQTVWTWTPCLSRVPPPPLLLKQSCLQNITKPFVVRLHFHHIRLTYCVKISSVRFSKFFVTLLTFIFHMLIRLSSFYCQKQGEVFQCDNKVEPLV